MIAVGRCRRNLITVESQAKLPETEQTDKDGCVQPEATQPSPATAVDDPEPREVGGRDGPDPTRYGDWEKNGRCIDF